MESTNLEFATILVQTLQLPFSHSMRYRFAVRGSTAGACPQMSAAQQCYPWEIRQ